MDKSKLSGLPIVSYQTQTNPTNNYQFDGKIGCSSDPGSQADAVATPGIVMGPKDTYRSPSVNPQNKKGLMIEGVGLQSAPVQETACPASTQGGDSIARSGPCWGITGHQGARPESLTSDKKAFLDHLNKHCGGDWGEPVGDEVPVFKANDGLEDDLEALTDQFREVYGHEWYE